MRCNLPDADVRRCEAAPRPPALTESQELCHWMKVLQSVDQPQQSPVLFAHRGCRAQNLGRGNVNLTGKVHNCWSLFWACLKFRQDQASFRRSRCSDAESAQAPCQAFSNLFNRLVAWFSDSP